MKLVMEKEICLIRHTLHLTKDPSGYWTIHEAEKFPSCDCLKLTGASSKDDICIVVEED